MTLLTLHSLPLMSIFTHMHIKGCNHHKVKQIPSFEADGLKESTYCCSHAQYGKCPLSLWVCVHMIVHVCDCASVLVAAWVDTMYPLTWVVLEFFGIQCASAKEVWMEMDLTDPFQMSCLWSEVCCDGMWLKGACRLKNMGVATFTVEHTFVIAFHLMVRLGWQRMTPCISWWGQIRTLPQPSLTIQWNNWPSVR